MSAYAARLLHIHHKHQVRNSLKNYALAALEADHFAWRSTTSGSELARRMTVASTASCNGRPCSSLPPLLLPLYSHLQHLNMSCAPFLAQKLFSVKGLVGASSFSRSPSSGFSGAGAPLAASEFEIARSHSHASAAVVTGGGTGIGEYSERTETLDPVKRACTS